MEIEKFRKLQNSVSHGPTISTTEYISKGTEIDVIKKTIVFILFIKENSLQIKNTQVQFPQTTWQLTIYLLN